MSVAGQALEQVPHGRRQTARRREAGLEALGLKGRRQLTEPEQRRDFLEARVLGVKPATLYAYVSRGVLRSYRQGIKRQRLYRRAEVEGLLRLAPSATRGSNVIPLRAASRRAIPLAESWIRD